jgi:hypothetical protein
MQSVPRLYNKDSDSDSDSDSESRRISTVGNSNQATTSEYCNRLILSVCYSGLLTV